MLLVFLGIFQSSLCRVYFVFVGAKGPMHDDFCSKVASVTEIWPSYSLLHQTVSYVIHIIVVVLIVITFGVAMSSGWCEIF